MDHDAAVCYCEAKHVQSFYASIARGDLKGGRSAITQISLEFVKKTTNVFEKFMGDWGFVHLLSFY